jgi:SNF2 family DNA or RNA helicase
VRHVKAVEETRDAKLPPKTEVVHNVELAAAERTLYDKLQTAIAARYRSLSARGRLGHHVATMMMLLSALRLAVVRPASVLKRDMDTIGSGAVDGATHATDNLKASIARVTPAEALAKIETMNLPGSVREMILRLAGDPPELDECVICYETLQQPVLLQCGHAFCRECVFSVLSDLVNKRQPKVCPICRKPSLDDAKIEIAVAPIIAMDEIVGDMDADELRDSTKIHFVVGLIQRLLREDKTAKFVIFSGFGEVITDTQRILQEAGIGAVVIDGTTTLQARGRLISSFQMPVAGVAGGSPKVCIVSSRAGNAGLTLTAANHLILMEPNPNSTVDTQATGRIHRLGQQRPVTIHRVVARGTVEERIQKSIEGGFASMQQLGFYIGA